MENRTRTMEHTEPAVRTCIKEFRFSKIGWLVSYESTKFSKHDWKVFFINLVKKFENTSAAISNLCSTLSLNLTTSQFCLIVDKTLFWSIFPYVCIIFHFYENELKE